VTPELEAQLVELGWIDLDGQLFRQDLPVSTGGTQTVLFGRHGADLALLAPIGDAVVDYSDARYDIDIAADIVVLVHRFAGTPTLKEIAAEAHDLAEYASGRADPHESPTTVVPAPPPEEAPTQMAPVVDEPTQLAPAAEPYGAPTMAGPVIEYAYSDEQPVIEFGYEGPQPEPEPEESSSRSPVLIAAVIAVAAVVLAAVVFVLTRDGSDSAAPVTIGEVGPCDVAPLMTPEKLTYSDRGLTVTTHIIPGCDSGDLLVNHGYRINVVDDTGKDVASGVFDLTGTPIAVGRSGATVDFTFPPGSFLRTADTINGAVRIIPHRDSYDGKPDSDTVSATAVTAAEPGIPETGDLEAAAATALTDIAAADRQILDDTLLDVWQPQLSSKRPGEVAEGITWTNADVLREHLQLRGRHPNARLVWSGDWPVYSDPTWWVTVAGVPFDSADGALGWCADQQYDAEHCLAKMLSQTRGSDGTAVPQGR